MERMRPRCSSARSIIALINKALPCRSLTRRHGLCSTPQVDEWLNFSDGLWLMGTNYVLWSGCSVNLHQFWGFFFKLIWSPVPVDVVVRRVVLSCIWLWLFERSDWPSAKSRSLSCVRSDNNIPLFLLDLVVPMIQSITKRKKICDSKHPCRTPVLT